MGTPAAKKPLTREQITALENAEDAAAAKAAREEMHLTGEKPRPWREVVAEMGIDPDDLGPDED